jgi:hypothetical protein
VRIALPLIAVGTLGTILLSDRPNFETILAVSLLAGALLRGAYVIVVPIGSILLASLFEYLVRFGGRFEPFQILGLTGFLVTGFLFVSLLGTRVRGRTLLRTKSLVIATGLSIPATLAYDVWTAVGAWRFIAPPGTDLLTVLQLQVPFTLVHLISSLIFVPLIGAGMGYYVEHILPASDSAKSSAPASEQSL